MRLVVPRNDLFIECTVGYLLSFAQWGGEVTRRVGEVTRSVGEVTQRASSCRRTFLVILVPSMLENVIRSLSPCIISLCTFMNGNAVL